NYLSGYLMKKIFEMAEGCPALDTLEREYASVVNQRPIPPMDFSDMDEEKTASQLHDEQFVESESEDEGVPTGYEPLQNDSDDEFADEKDSPEVLQPKENTKLSANAMETIQKAMQSISLPAPAWGKNLSDEELVALLLRQSAKPTACQTTSFAYLPTKDKMSIRSVTCSTPTNIAVIKYWGKDSVALNTPINSSVSVTLNQKQLKTVTSIVASQSFPADRIWLNAAEQDINNKRIQVVLKEMRRLASDKALDNDGKPIRKADWAKYKLHIVSINTFPTAAGLASSAAGYACLVAALIELFQAQEEYPGQFSVVARQGSGSACRSLDGGFVRWEKGTKADGSDSLAVQVADHEHWPELEAIICVVNDKEKDTSSTSGMMTSKDTSELLGFRAREVVDKRLTAIEAAYKAKDFATFGKITMMDSNQFHATCLDTYPPIFYMNEVSRSIIHMVHKYNDFKGGVKAAYTFDAGPNAVIFVEKQNTSEVLGLLLNYFDQAGDLEVRGDFDKTKAVKPVADLLNSLKIAAAPGALKMIYHTTVGEGRKVLPASESLINLATGLPK
ncbi:diphosphomevalonate decarboxylase, partial [Thraustotheca clavata]